jgi:hypothetical protein
MHINWGKKRLEGTTKCDPCRPHKWLLPRILRVDGEAWQSRAKAQTDHVIAIRQFVSTYRATELSGFAVGPPKPTLEPDNANGLRAKRWIRSAVQPCVADLLRLQHVSEFNVKGTVMKTLAFIALSVVATAAMATGPVPSSPEIIITGNSTQMASLTSVAVNNNSTGAKSEAYQNLASNTGNVTIGGTSVQTVTGFGGNVTNTASGSEAYASQNLSSNVGEVTISGHSTQFTAMMNASVNNLSSGSNSKAVQNIASNNACFTCQPTKTVGWPN